MILVLLSKFFSKYFQNNLYQSIFESKCFKVCLLVLKILYLHKKNTMIKVYSECCKNCLLSKDSIVSSKRAADIIKSCVANNKYFVCHKATMQDRSHEVVCKSFYDKFKDRINIFRIAQRLLAVEFVPQVDMERLISYSEIKSK